jgi:Family of unknown function (DUF5937)/Helix-turn-helix domain
MAIVGVTGPAAGRPVAVVSPLVELGSALHVLRDPGHHDAEGWAAEVRATISPRLSDSIASWSWTTQAIRATPFVTAFSAADDFAGELGRLRALPVPQLAGQLLRPISPVGDTRAALRWGRSRGPAVAGLVQSLVDHPAQAVADFVDFVERCWREWFAAEWARVQPGLAARARQFADMVSTRGAVPALVTLDPAVTPVSTGDGVAVAKIAKSRHDVSRRGLLVAPSAFIRPHLYVADVPRRPLLVIHPVQAGPPVPAVVELVRRLETVANPGRLEVARAIATEPRTSGEVAALWRLDPTLVNRHLRALAAVGLARTTRRGRFVQYQLDNAAVQALGTDLASLLLR